MRSLARLLRADPVFSTMNVTVTAVDPFARCAFETAAFVTPVFCDSGSTGFPYTDLPWVRSGNLHGRAPVRRSCSRSTDAAIARMCQANVQTK